MIADTVKFWWKRDPKAFQRGGKVRLAGWHDWFDMWHGEVEDWRVDFYVYEGAILGASVRVRPPSKATEE